jgi:hypothetical protein
MSASADESDDLDLIALLQPGVSPSGSRNDVAIAFHCDPSGLQLNPGKERGNRTSVGNFEGLTVHHDLHARKGS